VRELPAGSRLLLFGSANDRLRYLEAAAPPRSVVVVDDPDVLALKGFGDAAERFRCVEAVVGADIYGADDWLSALESEYSDRPFTAVVPGLEYPSAAAARFADRLGLPGAGAGAARCLRDKSALMARAAEAGIACPHSTLVHSAAEIRIPTQTPRWVLKPVDRQASVGVQVLGRDADLDAAWAAATGAGERSHPGRLFTGACLVQPYLDGPELSVEFLVVAGRTVFANVTEQVYAPGQHTVQLGHVVPARIDPDTRHALVALTQRLVAATGFHSGVVHAEWIIQDGTPYIVDCAGRLPGDSLVELIDLAYGVDLEGAFYGALAGLPVPRLPTDAARAAAICFLCPSPGTIVAVRGADAARAHPGLRRLDLPTPGTVTRDVVDAWGRSGELVVEAADARAAVATIARVLDALEVDLRPDGSDRATPIALTPTAPWSTGRPTSRDRQ
jgi:biotin carboxylase